MKTTAEILTAARDLIKDPARWTQYEYGRTDDGFGTDSADDAVCFCALGALGKVAGFEDLADSEGLDAEVILTECSRGLYEMSVLTVNDSLGHDAILRVFECAIGKAGA